MKYLFIIQQFAEGAAPASSTGAVSAASTSAVASEAAESTPKAEDKGSGLGKRKAKVNPLGNVIYGRTPENVSGQSKESEEASEAKTTETESKRKTLAELLEADPELKKEYEATVKTQVSERTKAHLDRRVQGSNASKAELDAMRPMLDVLAQHYKLDPKDTSAIAKAVSEDENYFKRAGFESGTDAKTAKNTFELLRENRRLKDEAEARRKSDEQANNRKVLFDSWNKEIPEVKKLYPSFNMDEEMKNPEFREFALQGKVKEGYEKVHRAEIDAAMMKYAHDKAEEKIANSVAAGRARPAEGAMSRDASPVYKTRPSDLTKEDRAEIKRRVRSGEKIIW
ncbi:MAG: hypothetical protein E7591_00900 [Ruminococcaceae bacterium]|nr:hypothetical protein [Oscillospiraceae bacterium]